jgi:spore coat polysaccharide biosynthesis predicted glycosyltransferase SpsG
VLAVADNQVELSRDVANAGYEIFLGHSRDVSAEDLSGHLKDLLQDADRRSHFRREGMKLVDGEGTRRIVQALMVPVSSGLS